MTPHGIHAWALRRSRGNYAEAVLVSQAIAAFLEAQAVHSSSRDIWPLLMDNFGTLTEISRASNVTIRCVSYWFQHRSIPRPRWDALIRAAALLDPPLLLTRAEFIASHRRRSF